MWVDYDYKRIAITITRRLVISVTFEIVIWTLKRGVRNQIILCRWREMNKVLCEIVQGESRMVIIVKTNFSLD